MLTRVLDIRRLQDYRRRRNTHVPIVCWFMLVNVVHLRESLARVLCHVCRVCCVTCCGSAPEGCAVDH